MKITLAAFACVAVNAKEAVEENVWYGKDGTAPLPAATTSDDGSPTKAPRSGGDEERRYDDLEAMAIKHWKKNGMTGKNKFDEKKYWAYGCHCYILGDRPMSSMGKGAPTDGLDNKCKAYKDCQKCVREKHGDECIGEFVRYTWKFSSKLQTFVAKNEEGSCERELFECDLKFVKDTFDQRDEYNADYHAFYSTTGFDHELDSFCPSTPGVPVDHMCCGGNDGPYYWIGLNKNQCCNGNVISANDQC